MTNYHAPFAVAIALLVLPSITREAGAQGRSGVEEIRTETARAEARLTMPMLRKLLPAQKQGQAAAKVSCDMALADSLGYRGFLDACPPLASAYTSAGFSKDEVLSALAALATAYLHVGAEMAAKDGLRKAPEPLPPGVRRDNVDLVRANFEELTELQ